MLGQNLVVVSLLVIWEKSQNNLRESRLIWYDMKSFTEKKAIQGEMSKTVLACLYFWQVKLMTLNKAWLMNGEKDTWEL